jgi:hypothetical protein
VPTPLLHQPSQIWQKDELTRGGRGGEQTDDETTAPHEPAIGDRSREDRRHRPGPQADDDPPQQIELPGHGHHDRQGSAGRNE